MISTIAILAGGLATRLQPITETIPKSMIEVAGKPFIVHQLDYMKKNKLSKVVICASNLGKQIEDFIGNGDEYGLDVKYSFDGEKLLGTGGAIKKALDLIGENFFVMYGDSYLMTNLEDVSDFFCSQSELGLMAVYKNEGKWDSSNIEYAYGEILNYDKKNKNESMNYIDYGLGILSKKAFDDFKSEEVFDLEDVYKNLLKKNQLLGYEVNERFYEIGSFDGLEETRRVLSSGS